MANSSDVLAIEPLNSDRPNVADPLASVPASLDPPGLVFVSHSSRNADAAMQIVAALEAAGVRCWVAPRDIRAGSDYNHSIMTGINSCRAMILVFSQHSADSGPVEREVERALNRRVPVIPVRLEQVPPSPALEYMISTSQWVDAFPPPLGRHLEKAIALIKQALDMTPAAPLPDRNAPAKFLGPFRLIERLGEGGMGTVYKAEQRSPVKRTVAVKLIKPGFDSTEVIARFESERQALARMDHPNVAKVLDAGADDMGRPYFVMEYVPGVPITKFADDNKLTVRQRLELFTQACDAIAHAHTKALLHRDIKATNVLAYLSAEGKPTVKVIDFGIAKALTGDRLTDRTFNTERGQAIGTYESMSPEQADGSPDIDMRTDVYSLGVLLYELLAGAAPFDKSALTKAADAEVRRIIREVDPPKPSTRLSALGGEGTQIAAARRAQLDALTHELRSELEWIPLMAMRKERDRRYASPLALSADIAKYLAGLPLIAGPESRVYRFRKFLGRNRAGLVTAAAVVILLLGGTAAHEYEMHASKARTVAALIEAKKQREEAETQKREANLQSDRATKKEKEADKNRGDANLQAAAARRALADLNDAKAQLRQLMNQPEVSPTSHLDIIKANLALTLLQQGKYADAESVLREAISFGAKKSGAGTKLTADQLAKLREEFGGRGAAMALPASLVAPTQETGATRSATH